MKKILKILIIEDYKMVVNGYETLLKHTDFGCEFKIDIAYNCTDAHTKIEQSSKGKSYDIIFLDIQLPASTDGKLLSGEDLGIKINKLLPDAKILVNTFLTDNYRLFNILKSIKPNAMLTKNEAGSEEIVEALKSIINGNLYYSNFILKLLNNDDYGKYKIDKTDRQLLYQLSLGTKMKDLPNFLPLEMAGIEKRKRRLKRIFNIKTTGNKELLGVAKEKGFI
ncbi:response regulator transcription factor [Aureibaculum algae]|uniref:Response regulator transcription factor n=1 Tax=Aureibaculum algae TaxID=2584122 RepID=A0A5B7TVE9_9FLAO|nr:response regulator transcription factor [Aureibaculum algae]QCX39066.1 response regulator transcription factor [Aureibaculum algae]